MKRWFVISFFALLLAPLTVASAGDGAAGAVAPTDLPTPTFAERAVELINAERLSNGALPPLKGVAALAAAAQGHSERMAEHDFFMHCDPDTGKLPWDRMADAGYTGYSCAAENIAAGYAAPEAVVAGWMASAKHRQSILSPDYWEVGVGYHYQYDDQKSLRCSSAGTCSPDTTIEGPYYHYWTQNFGKRADYYPVVINREAFYAGSINVALYVYGPVDATEMRFSNDGATWSEWEPFGNAKAWVLSPGNGNKTVHSQVRDGASTYDYSDTIVLNAPAPAAAAVRVVIPGAPVTLAWVHAAQNMGYAVYRSDADPYFSPDGTMPIGVVPAPANAGDEISFDDVSALIGISHFYVTRALAGDGLTVADSNRVGRLVFPLVSGGR